MRDQQLSLPKTLKSHEVEDLWKEKRQTVKLELLTRQSVPDCPESTKKRGNNSGTLQELSEPKSTYMDKSNTDGAVTPMLRNRLILENMNFKDQKYQEKTYQLAERRETFFRRTSYMMRDRSES